MNDTDTERGAGDARERAGRLVAELRWFEPRLTDRPGADFAQRNTTGETLGELLGRQDDEALAVSLAAGVCRKGVFEELLVIRYHRRLLAWFGRFGAGDEDAADLTQEVFLKVARGETDSFDPAKAASFAGYLHVVAHNLFVSSARKRRPGLAGENLERPGPDSTATVAEARELGERFDEEMAALPVPDGTILRLTIEGHAPREIATAVGLPANEVSQRLTRLRERLIESLKLQLAPSKRGRPRKSAAGPDQQPNN